MGTDLYRNTRGYKAFSIVNAVIITIFIAICLYPFLYTFSLSISDPFAVLAQRVGIIPVGFDTSAYQEAFRQPNFFRAYLNPIIYTVVATGISLTLSVLCAYPLSKRFLPGKNLIMVFILITMFFNGGLIPNFLLIQYLGLIDTMWALVLPLAIIQFFMIVLMVNFRSIPESLEESAAIDGLNPLRILISIVLPLSLPALATVGLFVVLFQWNSWFPALLYLNTARKYPVMLILQNLVISGSSMDVQTMDTPAAQLTVPASVKSATIMLVAIPVIVIYPFVQKFFIKGLLVGSIKG